MTKQTRREAYKHRILIGEKYVRTMIDDSDKLFTEDIEEAYANALSSVAEYMNKVICRTDIEDRVDARFKKFVVDFETIFLSMYVSSKLKKRHIKKVFKDFIKHYKNYLV